MHIPIAILANKAYSAREITAQELSLRLEESYKTLRRSLKMLLLESLSTPEGQLAKRGLQELKVLAQNIEDVKYLKDTNIPDVPKHSNSRKSKRSSPKV